MDTGHERSYQKTKLWELLKRKAAREGLGDKFIDGVGAICEEGESLSKTIIAFFPTFTLHDETHLSNVSRWIWLLLGKYAEKLTAKEAAWLLMAAWLHDIGMAVSDTEAGELRGDMETERWEAYFESHFDARQEYEKTGRVSDETLRDFVRAFHARRSGEKIRDTQWPPALTLDGGILQNDVADLCASHGLRLEDVRPYAPSFRRCAALLRLADLLDCDASRAPADLFAHMGLDSPFGEEKRVSREEWDKTRSGKFKEIENGIIHYHVSSSSLQLEMEIRKYLDYVKAELVKCNDFLSGQGGGWEGFAFPRDIKIVVQQNGYKSGDFRITMNQDRVLELLTGQNLYSDAGVFVRELLQNSIDAVLTRRRVDPDFGWDKTKKKKRSYPGKILVDTWSDGGYDWFRIEDDGTGMTEEIVTDYFLKVGCSYYASDAFRQEQSYAENEYTPISRFGIGVLSCFMADPENNLLQVSTKRYYRRGTEQPPAVRLDVDGLHGYYYLLTNEKVQTARPMRNPKNDHNKGFRTKPGTTICVRTSLRNLGGYSSFREILDKYIRFPEVEIEHCAWDRDGAPDRKTYPTQQELMRLLHEKNPGGPDRPLKEYSYPFPDALFEKVKKVTPDFIWERRPELVFQFLPLDWLDESGDLNGYAIFASVRCGAHSRPFDLDGESVSAELSIDFYYSKFNMDRAESLMIHCVAPLDGQIHRKIQNVQEVIRVWEAARKMFGKSGYYITDEIERFHREYAAYGNDAHWRAEIAEKLGTLPEELDEKYQRLHEKVEEAAALRKQYGEALKRYDGLRQMETIGHSISAFFWETVEKDPILRLAAPLLKEQIDSAIDTPTLASCNGVAIPYFTGEMGALRHHALFLLSGSYRPELNLARNHVLSLSPETFCALSFVSSVLFRFSGSLVSFGLGWDYRPSSGPRLSSPKLRLLPERNFLQIWKRHPSWEAYPKNYFYVSLESVHYLIQAGKAPVLVDFFHGRDKGAQSLLLAVAKARFEVRREFNERGYCYVSAGRAGGTDDFPPEMFFLPYKPCEALGYVKGSGDDYNYYNREHKFSEWLIAHGEAMRRERRAAAALRRLIEDMLTTKERTDLVKAIAFALDELKRLPGNPFHVSDELYVSEDSLLKA